MSDKSKVDQRIELALKVVRLRGELAAAEADLMGGGAVLVEAPKPVPLGGTESDRLRQLAQTRPGQTLTCTEIANLGSVNASNVPTLVKRLHWPRVSRGVYRMPKRGNGVAAEA